MSVSDGENANAANFNSAFMSREVDTSTVGKVDLSNVDSVSGTAIVNQQRELNSIASFTGKAVNVAKDNTPIWSSDAIGTPNENTKARVDSVQAQVETNTTDIANKVDKVASTNDAIVRFDGVTGDVQDSGVTIDDSDNVIIPGNLTVNGTTTTINTTNLDVTDKNITVNDGGNDASSEGAGLTVERTGTDGSIVYEDALASKFKLGALGSELEVLTSTATQSTSNKTVTASDIDLTGTASATNRAVVSSESTVNLTALARKKGAIYFDDTSNTYKGDDGSNLIDLGGTGGGGGLNFLSGDNTNFELTIGDWVAYADAAAATPVDGTGGAPTSTFTRTVVAAEILRGNASAELAKDAANRQGEGASVDFLIDEVDQGKRIFVKLDSKNSAALVNGDVIAFVFDVTNANLLGPLSNDDDGEIISNTGEGGGFVGSFEAAIDSQSYRLILHIATTNASAWDLFIDRVEIGPDTLVPGSIIQELGPLTTTGAWSANTNYASQYWREGSFLIGDVFISTSGLPTAATLTLNLPSGFVIDTDRLSGGTSIRQLLSTGGEILEGGVAVHPVEADFFTTTSMLLRFYDSTAAPVTYLAVTNTAPFAFNTGDSIHIKYKVPIVGFSSGALLSTTETLFSIPKVRYETSAGQSIDNNTDEIVNFDTETYDDQSLVVTGASWDFTAPKSGEYRVSSAVTYIDTANWDTGEIGRLSIYKNGVLYSVIDRLEIQDGTTNIIMALSGSDTVPLAKDDTLEVRAFQNTGSGLALTSTASENYVSIERIADFSVFSVHGQNEFLSATSSVKTPGTTGDWLLMVGNTVTLSAGAWVLYGSVEFLSSGTVDYTRLRTMWGSANGADSAATPAAIDNPSNVTLQAGKDDDADWDDLATIEAATLQASTLRLLLTSEQAIFLNANATGTAANARVTTYIYAERIS